MANKFIIFVAFASLAQSSFAQLPLTVTYGLSDEQLASLTQIIVNQEAALQAKFDAFDPIFDTIGKYASAVVWNVEAGTDDDSGKVAGALASAKNALDYALDAIPIVLQKPCFAVKIARKNIYAGLDDTFAVATEALTLAKSGDYSANRAQLDSYQAKVQEDLAVVVANVFNALRICIHTDDAATLGLIEASHEGTGLAIVHVANSVFNAIKVFGAAVTAGTADASLIKKIEDYRGYAHAGLRGDIENKFSAFRTIFIARQTEETAILSSLATNQYALTVVFYRYKANVEIIYSSITDYWTNVALGLYDSGNSDFSLTDAARAEADALMTAAHEVFLQSIETANPDATSAVEAVRETFATYASAFDTVFYQGLDIAAAVDLSLDEALAQIETLKTTALSGVGAYSDLIYDTLRNGETWDDETEAEFTKYQEAGSGILQDIVGNHNFNSIEIVVKAYRAKETTDAELSTIQTDLAAAVSGLNTFTQGVSAAGFVALKARNAE